MSKIKHLPMLKSRQDLVDLAVQLITYEIAGKSSKNNAQNNEESFVGVISKIDQLIESGKFEEASSFVNNSLRALDPHDFDKFEILIVKKEKITSKSQKERNSVPKLLDSLLDKQIDNSLMVRFSTLSDRFSRYGIDWEEIFKICSHRSAGFGNFFNVKLIESWRQKEFFDRTDLAILQELVQTLLELIQRTNRPESREQLVSFVGPFVETIFVTFNRKLNKFSPEHSNLTHGLMGLLALRIGCSLQQTVYHHDQNSGGILLKLARNMLSFRISDVALDLKDIFRQLSFVDICSNIHRLILLDLFALKINRCNKVEITSFQLAGMLLAALYDASFCQRLAALSDFEFETSLQHLLLSFWLPFRAWQLQGTKDDQKYNPVIASFHLLRIAPNILFLLVKRCKHRFRFNRESSSNLLLVHFLLEKIRFLLENRRELDASSKRLFQSCLKTWALLSLNSLFEPKFAFDKEISESFLKLVELVSQQRTKQSCFSRSFFGPVVLDANGDRNDDLLFRFCFLKMSRFIDLTDRKRLDKVNFLSLAKPLSRKQMIKCSAYASAWHAKSNWKTVENIADVLLNGSLPQRNFDWEW